MNKVKIPHSLNLLPKKLDLTVNFSVFDSDNFFVNFILFNTLGIFSTTVLVLVHSVFFSTTVLVHVHWRRLLLLSVCCFHIMYFTLKLDLLFQNEGIKSCWQKYHTCNCIKWRISKVYLVCFRLLTCMYFYYFSFYFWGRLFTHRPLIYALHKFYVPGMMSDVWSLVVSCWFSYIDLATGYWQLAATFTDILD